MLRPAEVPLGVTRPQVNGFILPPNRDSTSFNTLSVPGEQSGHELFRDVAAPGRYDEAAPQADYVFVVYNAGLSVWKITNDPEDPNKVDQKDGWPPPFGPGDWAVFPNGGEEDIFVSALDVIKDGNMIYIAISGRQGVGFSIWTFNTSTNALTQKYQDPYNLDSFDTALIEDPNGRFYAFAADQGSQGNDGGVKVYDVTTAVAGSLCVEPDGAHTCGVYEGELGNIPASQFVSAIVANGETYVAASDGKRQNGPLTLEIWEVANPENPGATPAGASVRRFIGLGTNVSSPQLFAYDGDTYLAFVENVGGSPNPDQMRIHDVDNCLDSDGCTTLGSAKATETIKNSFPNFHFLDVSFSNGSPFLHYGMETTGLFGSGFERLWDLGQLPGTSSPNTLPEITDTGGTYNDPCDNAEVDYFGDYYINNEYGLKNFNPRHAIFTGPYLYRSAKGVFDIHVRGGSQQTNDPSIIPRLQTGGSINSNTFWMDEEVPLEADVLNCLAGGTDWCWLAVVSNPNVADFPIPANANGCDPTFDDTHVMTFLCEASGRCADTSVAVSAWNMSASCGDTAGDPQEVNFNLKDPEVDATAIDTGGTSFPECQTVDLQASAVGRGAVEWSWLVDGEPIVGCGGVVPVGDDLSTASFQCEWDTSGLEFGLIFADFFESGTCESWDSGCPTTFKSAGTSRSKAATPRRGGLAEKAGGTVNVEFQVSAVAGPVLDVLGQSITFNPVGDPAFNGPLAVPVVNGSGATLQAAAFDTTTWTWEIEDPDVPGSPCSFNASDSCVTIETSVDTIDYLWQGAGTHLYKVSLSNCSSTGTVSLTGSATVLDATLPEIIDFGVALSSIQTAGDPDRPCCKPFPFTTVICPTNTAIEFEVEVIEAGSFNFLFDWERASTGDSPTYVPGTPVNVDGTTYTFSHAFPGTVPSPNFPISSVQFGNEFPLGDNLEFGSCP